MADNLTEIERMMDEVNEHQKNLNVRLSELRSRRQALLDERSTLLVEKFLGRSSKNGNLERLEKSIQEINGEIDQVIDVSAALQTRSADLIQERQAFKLAFNERRYTELCPEVERLVGEYMRLRGEIQKVVKAYNQKHGEAANLRPSIQELRHELNVGVKDCGDLPSLKNLNWKDTRTNISERHLRGEQSW